ncbi:MAG TPA: neutral/alkaline non-lysosomal ceramidase N-terminal domain-containing protein [Bacteroidales bacterium]|nr:neutral/alkaline non-lysosomal ceramidase N-terminal domain-containing protein [Bacteroidales bacterium]HPF02367.1 neutral/alkaline non-lysosomal ceramidase N-terminal domain-containing protein [Bacteroidales bacterium]HPJ58950.1 neutral/alkaline non-lysosomal ceramidase N-terminal domain-containing protein [Bacteroidales bacterium]HPR12204.1 neutral/alkaline non-lysosomal ceramidase N-terminal domain-containing protein [Bacteroidales bacterium]
MKLYLLVLLFLAWSLNMTAQYSAGIGRKVITPDIPVWLSGYASRNKPADGVLHDLWAKALAVEDEKGNRIVIVTLDIIGLSHELSEKITETISLKHRLSRSQLLLNTSHTHSGPVIYPSLGIMYDLGKEEMGALVKYQKKLTEGIVEAVGMAIGDLSPVSIFIGHGSAGFAVNRRQQTEKGMVIGVNKEGPVDHDVPVLKVETPEGQLKAVLFGYACHNTTLDIYQVNGDYAGFAQIEIEKANPGVTAMFIAGCGADQNPDPRRSVEMAQRHGKELASAVCEVLEGEFKTVGTPVRTGFASVDLELAPVSMESYNQDLAGENRYKAARAQFILSAMDKGYDVNSLVYPVQAVRFGKDFTILALGGEVVVDYSLISKKRYPKENLFVAGYCGEVPCYIPSARILREGGYEPETSMIYYGMPGPFSENVEAKVFSAIDRVMKKTGAKPVTRNYTTAF